LLFADLALKQEGFGEILPGAAAFILDEAHQIPELAGQFFSQSISARQLTEMAQDALIECNGITGAIGLLLEPVEALQDALRKLRLAMDVLPSRGAFQLLEDRADVRTSLHDLRERAELFTERLDRIVESHDDHDVRWYETFPRGFALYATPLDLAVPMRGLRERTQAAWIHTSATLSVAGNFDHFARQLGLDEPQTLSLESPFDYAHQGLC